MSYSDFKEMHDVDYESDADDVELVKICNSISGYDTIDTHTHEQPTNIKVLDDILIIKCIQQYYKTHEHIRKILDGVDIYVPDDTIPNLTWCPNHLYFYIDDDKQIANLKKIIKQYIDHHYVDAMSAIQSLTIVFVIIDKTHNPELFGFAYWFNKLLLSLSDTNIPETAKNIDLNKLLYLNPKTNIIKQCHNIQITCCKAVNGRMYRPSTY